jgi:hypothetical protein
MGPCDGTPRTGDGSRLAEAALHAHTSGGAAVAVARFVTPPAPQGMHDIAPLLGDLRFRESP